MACESESKIVFHNKQVDDKAKNNLEGISMLEYYQDHQYTGLELPEEPGFDPIRRKYNVGTIAAGLFQEFQKDRDRFKELGEEKFEAIEDVFRISLSEEDKKSALCELVYQWFSQYEANAGVSSLKQRDFNHTMGNLHMIYNQRLNEIRDVVRLMDMVSRHVINQYIGIDGLENLFSEQYIDFEWEMHLGMDNGKNSMEYYRAHFIHQIL